MDSKTCLEILAQVKAAREKSAMSPATESLLHALAPTLLGAGIGGGVGGIHAAVHGKKIGRGIGHGAMLGGGAGLGATVGGTLGTIGGGIGGAVGGAALGHGIAPGVSAQEDHDLGVGAAAGGMGVGAVGGLGMGAGLGGLLGYHAVQNKLKKNDHEKEGRDPSGEAFADALQGMAATQLRSDAFKDVRNVGLTALGAGAAGRGLVGLLQMLRSNRAKKTRSGPANLPLPYPAVPHEKLGEGFLSGGDATSKSGIPWYGPAMLLGGMGGLGLGWHGMDKILNARRQREMQSEVESARQQFHDALLNQYDEPIKVHPNALGQKKASDATMVKVGQALDALFGEFQNALAEREKAALDWPNLAGQAAGGYGMYAGLSGLLTGALVYDKINKRSRRAILEKALQRRQRRKFSQQPTEIYATPEPMAAAPNVPDAAPSAV